MALQAKCSIDKYVCRECWELGLNPLYHNAIGSGCGNTSLIITDRLGNYDCCEAGHCWVNPLHIVFIDDRWRDIRALESCFSKILTSKVTLKQCEWSYPKKSCFCCQYLDKCSFAHSEHEVNYWTEEILNPREPVLKNIYDRLQSIVIDQLKVLFSLRPDINIYHIDDALITKLNSIPVGEALLKIKFLISMPEIHSPIKKLMHMLSEPLYKFEKVRSIPRIFNNIGFVREESLLDNFGMSTTLPYHLVRHYERAITPTQFPIQINTTLLSSTRLLT